jgi:hypothetical protein
MSAFCSLFLWLRNDALNWKVTGKNTKGNRCTVLCEIHTSTADKPREKFCQHILHATIPGLAAYLPCQLRHSQHSLSACPIYQHNRHVSISRVSVYPVFQHWHVSVSGPSISGQHVRAVSVSTTSA